MFETLIEWDRALFTFLNNAHAAWADPVMATISDKWFWVPMYVVLAGLVWWRSNLLSMIWVLIAIALLVTMADQFTSSFLKPTVERLRPCHNPALAPVHIVNDHCGGKFGFASGHAANTMAVAVFLGRWFRQNGLKVLMPLLLAWAVANAYSRIYLGVHFPGDVLAGMLIGFGLALLVEWLWRRLLTSLPARFSG